MPQEFIDFIKYCRELKFEEKPDYNFLRRQFKDLFSRRGYEYDYIYDWTAMLKKQKMAEKQATGKVAADEDVAAEGILAQRGLDAKQSFADARTAHYGGQKEAMARARALIAAEMAGGGAGE